MKKNRSVIIAPHPDDEWIGCGCTLLKNESESMPTKVVLVTGRVKKRVKLSTDLAKKHNYELVLLNQEEKNLNLSDLIKSLKKEILVGDKIYIPSIDTHPDHQLINIAVRSEFKNDIFEYGIYNNSNNFVVKAKGYFKQKFFGVNDASFIRGHANKVSFKLNTKAKYIKQFEEVPRTFDLIRKSLPLNEKKLNIAFLTKDYNTETVDAGFTSIVELAIGLKKLGHNPVMISSQGYSSWYGPAATKKYEVYRGIPVYRPYGLKWFNIRKMYFNPATIFNRFIAAGIGVGYVQRKLKLKFDIFHGSSSAPILFTSSLIGKLYSPRAKIFHTIRSESIFNAYGKIPCKLFNLTDGIFVPLTLLKDKLLTGGTLLRKIHLVHSGVVLDRFRKHGNSEPARNELNIPENSKVVFYYGKGGKNKGVEYLVESFKYFKKSDNVHLVLVHPVVWLPHLVKMVENHPLRENIHLEVGKINVPDYLSLSDVLVLPYLTVRGTEGNPLCLIEGMVHGVPVVTTRQPELLEIVTPGEHVMMAKGKNAKSLYQEISKVLTDSKLSSKLIKNSKIRAEDFEMKDIVKQHLDQYIISINK